MFDARGAGAKFVGAPATAVMGDVVAETSFWRLDGGVSLTDMSKAFVCE